MRGREGEREREREERERARERKRERARERERFARDVLPPRPMVSEGIEECAISLFRIIAALK
jgi:hypothetical protein